MSCCKRASSTDNEQHRSQLALNTPIYSAVRAYITCARKTTCSELSLSLLCQRSVGYDQRGAPSATEQGDSAQCSPDEAAAVSTSVEGATLRQQLRDEDVVGRRLLLPP